MTLPLLPADPSPAGWLVAQLKPNGLALALRNLARQGVDCLMPGVAVSRRQGGRVLRRVEPAFPGYLLVRPAPGAEAAPIGHSRGVARLLLGEGRRPVPLPPDFVAALLARCDGSGLIAAPDDLAPGDAVRIAEGPFAEALARIEALDGRGRALVLMSCLGQEVRLGLAADQLRKA